MSGLLGWSAQQLAEFLTVLSSSAADEQSALRGGIERIAQSFEAEVGAVVEQGSVRTSLGFATGTVPEDDLVAVAAGQRHSLAVPGAGTCRVAVVPVDPDAGSVLVLARSGEDGVRPRGAVPAAGDGGGAGPRPATAAHARARACPA